MRCQFKAESLLFPTMYKSQKVTFPTCSGFCGSGSHIRAKITRYSYLDGTESPWSIKCADGICVKCIIIHSPLWHLLVGVLVPTVLTSPPAEPPLAALARPCELPPSVSIVKWSFSLSWMVPICSWRSCWMSYNRKSIIGN